MHSFINAKNGIEKEVVKMIEKEEYVSFLKAIISCIDHGDYYSVKELSNFELEKMNKKEKILVKK